MAPTPSTSLVELAIRTHLDFPEDRDALAAAVRLSLDWFAADHPGRAVEVRVPPFRVVQVLGGTSHKRGTPPAVVEMAPHVWIELVTGKRHWGELTACGAIIASGERSDLSALFHAPLINFR